MAAAATAVPKTVNSKSSAPGAPPTTGSARTAGTIRFEVEPRSAEVYVDGFAVGSVDAVNSKGGLTASPGWHRLEFRAPGYDTPAVNVTLEAAQEITYHLALRRHQ